MTTITYVLYQVINENGHTRHKQKASAHSRQDTPDLLAVYHRLAKHLKHKPKRGTYYLLEEGGCLSLIHIKTGQVLYTVEPVCW